MVTRYGEMCDMVSAFAIYKGAEPKRKRKTLSFEEALSLR